MGYDFIFHQDNAAIHKSHKTKECFFFSKNIEVFEWSAGSPDFSPIENVIRRKNSRTDKFVNSMKYRVFELIKRKGSNIDY